jgi:hypothetical protein
MGITLGRGDQKDTDDQDDKPGGDKEWLDRMHKLLLQLFPPPENNRGQQDGPDRYRVFPQQGGEVSITRDKITLHDVAPADHWTFKAVTLLVKETWGSAVVSGGTKDDHIAAIAHGRAAGVKITSAAENQFTKQDWKKINEWAENLRPLYKQSVFDDPPKPNPPGPPPKPDPFATLGL